MTLYHEIITGAPHHSGRAIEATDILDFVRGHFGEPIFRSYWAVGEDGKKHIHSEGSLTGYSGPLWAPAIVIDVDAPSFSDALALTRDVCEKLWRAHEVPENAVSVWFSGGKGYHIHVPGQLVHQHQGTDRLPDAVRALAEHFFGGWLEDTASNEPHIDVSMTEHRWPTGLIRVPWSAHEETGCYKVPIVNAELHKQADEHKRWAQRPKEFRADVRHEPLDAEIEPVSVDLSTEEDKGISPVEPLTDGESASEPASEHDVEKPDYITCMWHLARRGPVDGRRHHDLQRLMAAWAHKGLTQPELEALGTRFLHAPDKGLPIDDDGKEAVRDMAARATGNHPNFDNKRWTRFQCDDEIMSEFCDEQCKFYPYRDEEETVLDADAQADAALEYLALKDEDGIDIGAAFGSATSCPVLPGEVVTIYGDTGLGKTSFMQGVALANDHLRVLDMSFEMAIGLQVTRYTQIKHGLRVNTQKGINEPKAIRQDDPDQYRQLVHEATSHISITTTPPRLDDLERLIREHKADIVIVDPVGKIRVNAPELQQPVKLYRTQKNIARRLGVTFLNVRHIRKQGQGDFQPSIRHIKGQKVVAEESNHVLAFGGRRDHRKRYVERVKGTRPIDFEMWLLGDPETWRFQAGSFGENGQHEPTSESVSTDDVDLPS